jgi:hypothetical protein
VDSQERTGKREEAISASKRERKEDIMAEQNRNEQNIRRGPFVDTHEEVHQQIDIEHADEIAVAGDAQEPDHPRHPDVAAEKNAARSGPKPEKGRDRRIVNPKNNSSNQYR